MKVNTKIIEITIVCNADELFPSVKSDKQYAIMDLVASILPKYVSIGVRGGEVKPNYGTFIEYNNTSHGRTRNDS